MNIGIVSYWFNRGQATVGRYIRSILINKVIIHTSSHVLLKVNL